MEYTEQLPGDHLTWLSFYQAAKPHFPSHGDDFYCMIHTPPKFSIESDEIVSSLARTAKHRYSISYIREQLINELIEANNAQTFSFEELDMLDFSLNATEQHPNGAIISPVRIKVHQLKRDAYERKMAAYLNGLRLRQ